MTTLAQFHFIRPYWLLAFLPLLLLLWQVYRRKLGNPHWEAFCDAALLPHILTRPTARPRHYLLLWLAITGALAILALAGPAWKKLPQPVFSDQRALVIALDLSRSMDANDLTPDRITRARFKISDLLAARPDGQTALLVYAGDAFVVTPLTDDAETITAQLNALTPAIMPAPGNRTDLALDRAGALLTQAGMSQGSVLLITDEVALPPPDEAVARLRQQGASLSILGVGSQHGVPVPLADGSFLKGADGEIIIPVLKEAPMRKLAALGGGIYHRLSNNDADIDALLRYLQRDGTPQMAERTELQTDLWHEQGPWLVLLLLPLVAMSFRKGYLLLLLAWLPVTEEATAFGWRDLWLNSNQQGERAMNSEHYDEAQALFQDEQWKAAAAYKARDYAAALEHLEGLDGITADYNRANAHAMLGDYPQAIAAYDEVLAADSDHEDARFNKDLLEQALKQQPQPQQGGNAAEQEKQQSPNQQESDGQAGQQENDQHENDEQQENGQQANQKESNRQSPADAAASDPPQTPPDSPAETGQHKDEQETDQQAATPPQQTPSGQDEPASEEAPVQAPQAAQAAEPVRVDEDNQAIEQWLRRIPDDPAGLLRRKFQFQYGRRQQDANAADTSW